MFTDKVNAVPRVLIADDDPVIRHWLTSILENEGYEVVSASDGREVYRLLCSDANFKGAILDLAMPYLAGSDVIRHMRSEKRLMRIPVMIITAESQIELLASGLSAGATVLLPKPFTKAQLQSTLSMMLGAKPETRKTSLPTNARRTSLTDGALQREPSPATVAIEERRTAAPADQPVDLNVLMGLGIGDDQEAKELIEELIDLYLENAERDVTAIKVATIGHKEDSLKERAHALKGSSSTIGAGRIARLCEQLQTGGEQSPRERTEDLARQLESELASARSVLLAIRAEGLHPARA